LKNRFIDEIAAMLLQKHSDELDKICVVFPNRRASVYLKESLAQQSEKIIWSPEIFSTQDFVASHSNCAIEEPLALLFHLYDAYKSLQLSSYDDFDIFSDWALGLLSDFNEISLYVDNPDALFNYLNEAKAIELWAEQLDELTVMQKNYLSFWKMLSSLYKKYNEVLLTKKLANAGSAFRQVAGLEAEAFITNKRKHIYFAGFNALTKAESDFMKKLCAAGYATMLWDADAYYYQNPNHEAGHFLRKIEREWHSLDSITASNRILEQERNITIIGNAKNIAQTQTAGRIVKKLYDEGANLSEIAIVLADESLLLPQLEALPDAIEKVNITMGYPLQSTSAAGLVKQLLKLITESQKLSKRQNESTRLFYSHAVNALFNNPLISNYFDLISHGKIEKKLANAALFSKSFYVNVDDLNALLSSAGVDHYFIDLLGQNINNPIQLANNLIAFLDAMLHVFLKHENRIDSMTSESIFLVRNLIYNVSQLIANHHVEINLQSFEKLISRQLNAQQINFFGEPLAGLQLMGMLETRCLDFKHLIMLSVNEGTLPKGRSNNSFIPIDIKKLFGIPVFSDSDAIFSYHFYRLLQRSSNVYLLYNTEPDELGKGEPSRFIMQLQHELKDSKTKFFKTIEPNQKKLEQTALDISIPKNDEIMRILNERAEFGLSPSAINTFMSCGLKYYFNYVLRVTVPNEQDESFGMDELGTAVHDVLEQLYKGFLNHQIEHTQLELLSKNINENIKSSLKNSFGGKNPDFGRNKLLALVAQRFAENFLKQEISAVANENIQLLSVETSFETHIELPDSNRKIKLKGLADRIDRIGDLVRIIDYKTGKVDASKLKFVDAADFFDGNKDTSKVLQLLLYAYIYLKENPTINKVQPAIFALRNFSKLNNPINFNGNYIVTQEDLPIIEDLLSSILSDLFHPDYEFSQTDDRKICEYCDFAGVCNRL